MSNMRQISIKELKRNLEYLLVPGYEQSSTPFIWGKPGIGKSDLVRQTCKHLEEITGNEYQFIDLRLSQLESADLRGIPIPDLNSGTTRWLPPEFLPFKNIEKFKGTCGILLLDEMNRAASDVIQAAFQLVLDRTVGEHTLLDTWFIVAAGNLGFEDGTDVNEFDTALNNRFIHFEVRENIKAWIEWAKKSGINSDIVSFLDSSPKYLYQNEKAEDEKVFVTPRSWEKFSNILKANEKIDPLVITQNLGSNLLNGAANHFIKYLETKTIVSGKDVCQNYYMFNKGKPNKDKDSPIKSKLNNMTRDQIYGIIDDIVTYGVKNYEKSTNGMKKKILNNINGFCHEMIEKDIYVSFWKKLCKSDDELHGEDKTLLTDDYYDEFEEDMNFVMELLEVSGA